MKGKRNPRWSKAQREKFRQTMEAKRRGSVLDEAAAQAMELADVRRGIHKELRPHNPFRDLHETLDAYFQHLGLEDKIDVIRQVVGLTKK